MKGDFVYLLQPSFFSIVYVHSLYDTLIHIIRIRHVGIKQRIVLLGFRDRLFAI